MRNNRLVAAALWAIIAVPTIAGFAMFSPAPGPPEQAVEAPVRASSDVGTAAGRAAALAFAAALPDSFARQALDESALIEAAMAEMATTTTTTTTVAQRTPPRRATTTTTTTEPPPPTTTPTTTATAPPAPPPSSGPLTEAQARDLISRYFQGEDVEVALKVAWCESRYDPSATNPRTGAAGLFQHLTKYWDSRSAAAGWAGADIYDAEANTAVAAWLVYEGGGWKHWSSCL